MAHHQSYCYCINLRRSCGFISDLYDAELANCGLTVAQYSLLINLSRLEKANISHWAERVNLERSTMVRNIRVLEKHQFIRLTGGRGKTYTLSEKGQQTLQAAIPKWQAAQDKIECLLGKDEAEALLRIGDKIQRLIIETR